jgi:hypothetical protein
MTADVSERMKAKRQLSFILKYWKRKDQSRVYAMSISFKRKANRDLTPSVIQKLKAGGMAQVGEGLLSKHQA